MAPKLASDSKLSQDDFRRLMMTPRDTPGAAGGSGSFGATPRRTNEQRPGGGDGHGRGERRRPDGGNKKFDGPLCRGRGLSPAVDAPGTPVV